eukprot:g2978.t1
MTAVARQGFERENNLPRGVCELRSERMRSICHLLVKSGHLWKIRKAVASEPPKHPKGTKDSVTPSFVSQQTYMCQRWREEIDREVQHEVDLDVFSTKAVVWRVPHALESDAAQSEAFGRLRQDVHHALTACVQAATENIRGLLERDEWILVKKTYGDEEENDDDGGQLDGFFKRMRQRANEMGIDATLETRANYEMRKGMALRSLPLLWIYEHYILTMSDKNFDVFTPKIRDLVDRHMDFKCRGAKCRAGDHRCGHTAIALFDEILETLRRDPEEPDYGYRFFYKPEMFIRFFDKVLVRSAFSGESVLWKFHMQPDHVFLLETNGFGFARVYQSWIHHFSIEQWLDNESELDCGILSLDPNKEAHKVKIRAARSKFGSGHSVWIERLRPLFKATDEAVLKYAPSLMDGNRNEEEPEWQEALNAQTAVTETLGLPYFSELGLLQWWKKKLMEGKEPPPQIYVDIIIIIMLRNLSAIRPYRLLNIRRAYAATTTKVPASAVKELRQMTGAGLMDCKKALQAEEGDMDGAIEWLRTNGLAKAAKKSDRDANQGLVGIRVDPEGNRAVLVEVNSETDFVSRNEMFQELMQTTTECAVEAKEDGSVQSLLETPLPNDRETTLQEEVHRVAAAVGENIKVRRVASIRSTEGSDEDAKRTTTMIGSYVHGPPVPGANCGQSVAAVALDCVVAEESAADAKALEVLQSTLAKQICMHIVAASPKFLDTSSVDPEAAAKEEAILTEEARNSGKSEKHIPNMVKGRMNKYYKENCLVEQQWLLGSDNEKASVQKILDTHAKDTDGVEAFRIASFVRFQLGEEINA